MIPRRHFLALLGAATTANALGQEAKIRIGQIGTRHSHAAGKMEAIRRLDDLYEVAGLASSDETSAAVYTGLPRMSEEALLALAGLQAVAIETKIEAACPTALKALRAGKHIHLDKPAAFDHAAFRAMRLEAEQCQLTVQMGYMLRYNPAFKLLFQAVREGWLGEILEIDAMMGKLASDTIRKSIGELDGGGMFELACHTIDAVVTILGKPAQVQAFSTPTQSDGVKDNQLAVLVYPKATVTIRCNHADPFGNPRRRFQVAGTKGAMEIKPLESGEFTLSLTEAHGAWKKGTQSAKLPLPLGRYDEEFVDLAKVIRKQKHFAWDATHDITVHETILKASGLLT